MQEGSVSTLQCLPSQHSVIVIAIVACDDSVIALRIVFGHAIPTRKLVGNACMNLFTRKRLTTLAKGRDQFPLTKFQHRTLIPSAIAL